MWIDARRVLLPWVTPSVAVLSSVSVGAGESDLDEFEDRDDDEGVEGVSLPFSEQIHQQWHYDDTHEVCYDKIEGGAGG